MNELAAEITKALEEYSEEVDIALERTKNDLARQAVKELKSTSPVGTRGKYQKGWRVKKIGRMRVVYNKTDYQLTHLLEKGHAKRNGGRTRALPHIRPAEAHVQQSAEKTFKKRLR